jgi:hypothetical protein
MRSRRLAVHRILLSSLAVLVLSYVADAQTAHPLAGTWKVNLAKSKYEPASGAPRSGTVKIEVTGDTIRIVNDGVDAQGRVTHSEYTAKFDGKDYPWKGTVDGQPNLGQDTVAWKKIDDRTYELVGKLKGQALGTQRIVLAADGKSRTNTVSGKGADGQTINNVVILDKQ